MMDRMLLQKVGGVQPNPFQDAFVAYSLRDLGLGANEVVIVQRASNNDFDGFTPAQITDGSLTSFCNGLGKVKEWIDQKNGFNAVNNDFLIMPQIVDVNGNLILENGLPCLNYNRDAFLIAQGFTLNQPNEFFIVCQKTIDNGYLFDSANNQNRQAQSSNWIFAGNTTVQPYINAFDQQQILLNVLFNTVSEGRINGNLTDSGNAGTQPLIDLTIGSRIAGAPVSGYLIGTIQEFIICDSNQTSNRNLFETNINNYYNIY